jgi:hypothetical protein
MNSWLVITRYLFFLTLYRVSYEAANAGREPPPRSFLIEKDPLGPIANPRQKEWSEKAIQKYTASQGKKWQRWNEAMFEKVN